MIDAGHGQADNSQDMGGLERLHGLEKVKEQVAGVVAVIQAEQARRAAGIPITRPAWKNLVFIGPPGSGKSRTAAAVGRIYRGLGILSVGHLMEVASENLVATTSRKTSELLFHAVGRASGGVLMINVSEPGPRTDGQQLSGALLEFLADTRFLASRHLSPGEHDDLVIVLAGQATQVNAMLHGTPALTSRFPAIIHFPGYTPGDLAAIFATLASEAGFSLTREARRKSASVLANAGRVPGCPSARLAVRLLNDAAANQARRIATTAQLISPNDLGAICGNDIPDRIDASRAKDSDARPAPGQYL